MRLPAALLRDTPIASWLFVPYSRRDSLSRGAPAPCHVAAGHADSLSLSIQANPMPGLEGEDGYEAYSERAKMHELKNLHQRVCTGDMSQGLGTAEQYAAMRKG